MNIITRKKYKQQLFYMFTEMCSKHRLTRFLHLVCATIFPKMSVPSNHQTDVKPIS